MSLLNTAPVNQGQDANRRREMYDEIKQIAEECGIEVSLFGDENTKLIVSMLRSEELPPDSFDEAVKARGYKVSHSSGVCAVSK